MQTTINIIGAGRLGKTLAKLCIIYKVGQLKGICNQSMDSSRLAIQFIGAGQAYKNIADLPPADLTIITTADEKIAVASAELAQSTNLKKGSTIIHCSGSLSSQILCSLTKKGVYLASVHPMQSFADPELSIAQFKGTYCAIEADEQAEKICQNFFNKIGAQTFFIKREHKQLYHAAGVIASNYLVTLAAQALNCFNTAGIATETAIAIILSLMQSTLKNLNKTHSPQQALTGPIARGDCSIIQRHIEIMPNESLSQFYKLLAELTIELTEHDEVLKAKLKQALQSKAQ